jgi:hypothetical protein
LDNVTAATVLVKLGRLLAGGAPRPEESRIPIWLTRLQRNDNAWLTANRLERRERYDDARRLYLQDAARQTGRRFHARVALARAASAEMTSRLGDEHLARSEWQRAAEHFRAHAEQAMRWSLREASWAYERSAQLYGVAGLSGEAAEMRRRASDLTAHVALPVDGIDVAVARPHTQPHP